jgi:glycosyltransferase involved in cell wall biosynthesis
MITTFFPPYNFGGDGIYVRRLSDELARRGHKVDVIHCTDSYRLLAPGDPPESYDVHPGVRVHGLQSPWGYLSPLATQQTGQPLLKRKRILEILRSGFDIIHYHNISLVGGPGILRYGRGIKLYTMHEHWLLCPTHTLFRFNRAVCRRRWCFACSLIHRRPPQWWRYTGLLKESLKQVDAFLALNRFAGTKHEQLGSLPIRILPPFIPGGETVGMTGPAHEDSEESYFLFVGRLEKLKGLQTLIPLFRRYGKAELRIVGTGNYEAHLRRMAGDSRNIRFMGYLPERELSSLYRRARGLIVPSICLEMAPQVVLEAFRMGAPVIVRNLGGLPELVEDSGGGVAYGDDDQLLTVLDRLLSDQDYREEMGRRGHQAVRTKWTAAAHLCSYLALIDELQTKRKFADSHH